MVSNYRGFQPAQPVSEWFTQVVDQLKLLAFTDPLTQQQQRWLLRIWDTCDLSVEEVAEAFLAETFID